MATESVSNQLNVRSAASSRVEGNDSDCVPADTTVMAVPVRLPNMKKPCRDCPYRKDSLKGWLGGDRMAELLEADSFVCHKDTTMQCAGHMLINGERNGFVHLANNMGVTLDLKGKELVFESREACIEHHAWTGD